MLVSPPTARDVEAIARQWLGVPFLHQGRTRLGVDCAGLVICVARHLGVVPKEFDISGYTRSPDGSMLSVCDTILAPAEAPAPGCVVVMRFSVAPQHLAIVGSYRHGGLSLLHALQRSGSVVEHRLDSTTARRIVRSYHFRPN